ncbi:hypothetical protein PNP85_15655, partial [Halobacterium salinarum]|uniref:hypothetical protein n=1 Tax=Halobacterium salinarum TaxID=2242 RepID=UPI0025545FAC
MEISARTTSLFAGAVGILSLAGSLVFKIELIRYPLFTVAIASFLFAVYDYLPSITLAKLSPPQERAFNSLIFLLIAATGVLGQLGSPGVLDVYYVAVIATAGVLAYRIARDPVRPSLMISQIVLFALLLRATLWFSYPVYGADRFHFGATGWIVNQGVRVPQSITYYHDFPIAHIFAGIWTMLADLPLKVGY